MPLIKLTKTVAASTPYTSTTAGSRAPLYLWDTQERGLGLRIDPSGRRTWVISYRIEGTRRVVKLRRWSERDDLDKGDQAIRKLAAVELGKVASGRDPAEEKAARKAIATLADAWEKFKTSRWEALSEWTRRDYLNRWRAHLGPALGSKRLDKITGGDVQDVYDSLRAKPTTANHTLGLLSTIWSYAAGRGDLGITPMSPNPSRVITKTTRYTKRPRTRMASPSELRAFLAAVDEKAASGALSPCEAVGLLLVPYSLLRITDVVRLQWAWVDLDARTITIPPDKAKGAMIARSTEPEIAVLSRPMVARLAKLERWDPHVVPSTRGGGRYDLKAPYALVRPAEDLGHYDFKRTAETMLRDAGVSQSWIDAAARHRPQDVGQRHYAQATTVQAMKAIDRLAKLLEKARG